MKPRLFEGEIIDHDAAHFPTLQETTSSLPNANISVKLRKYVTVFTSSIREFNQHFQDLAVLSCSQSLSLLMWKEYRRVCSWSWLTVTFMMYFKRLTSPKPSTIIPIRSSFYRWMKFISDAIIFNSSVQHKVLKTRSLRSWIKRLIVLDNLFYSPCCPKFGHPLAGFCPCSKKIKIKREGLERQGWFERGRTDCTEQWEGQGSKMNPVM